MRPTVKALRFFDQQVVDAGMAVMHEAGSVKLPIFVAVGAKPVSGVVVPFVSEAHSNPIAPKGPKLFDQAIVQLFGPFASEKRDDFLPSVHKSRAVSPA